MTCLSRNVKVKICEYNIANERSVEIVDDIFRKKLGAVYIEGLVDTYDTEDFDEKLEKEETKRNGEMFHNLAALTLKDL